MLAAKVPPVPKHVIEVPQLLPPADEGAPCGCDAADTASYDSDVPSGHIPPDRPAGLAPSNLLQGLWEPLWDPRPPEPPAFPVVEEAGHRAEEAAEWPSAGDAYSNRNFMSDRSGEDIGSDTFSDDLGYSNVCFPVDSSLG
eukprot:8421849-Pyramimonas_sp.AAC.1